MLSPTLQELFNQTVIDDRHRQATAMRWRSSTLRRPRPRRHDPLGSHFVGHYVEMLFAGTFGRLSRA
jgi:hypothetical protein